MSLLHDRFGTAAVLYMLVVGLWGLIAYARGGGVSGSYRGTLIIGEGMLLLQVLLGVSLLLLGYRPAEPLHLLYGILIPLVLPFVTGLVRGQPGRRAALYYGLAGLFIFGLALRALATGG